MSDNNSPMFSGKPPPRYYFGVIVKLRPELREEALSRVPEGLRDWVAELVRDYFKKLECIKGGLR